MAASSWATPTQLVNSPRIQGAWLWRLPLTPPLCQPPSSLSSFVAPPLSSSLPPRPLSHRTFASSLVPMAPLRVVAIAGSFRKASFHQGLVRAAIEISKEQLPDVEIHPVAISHLPFVNTDLEIDGHFPDAVEEFRAKVLEANSILFACPEHNYSIPGVLKNAIDWGSRQPNVWADKPAAIVSAGGGFGGGRAQYHLRQVGVFVDLHFLNKPELFIRAFEPPTKFDKEGNLVDAATRQRLEQLLVALRSWTARLQKS